MTRTNGCRVQYRIKRRASHERVVLIVYFRGQPGRQEIVEALAQRLMDCDGGAALDQFDRDQILGGNYRIDTIEILEAQGG